MARKRKKPPKLSWHKSSKQWYATIDGVEVHFGRDPNGGRDKPAPLEVQRKYNARIAEWLAERAEQPAPVRACPTVMELVAGYLAYAESYYVKDGRPTSELQSITDAVRPVLRLYGTERADQFGPSKLKAVRQAILDQPVTRVVRRRGRDGLIAEERKQVAPGPTRKHVNKQISRVRRMYRWAVEQELTPATVLHSLEAVADLPKGRGGVREGKEVTEVAEATINATLPRLPASLRVLVRLHWLVGCRAAEACIMHVEDIDQAPPEGDGLWLWKPRAYKTDHLDDEPGEALDYWIGPQAQAILTPMIEAARRPPERKSYYARRRNADAPPVGWLFPSGRTRGTGHFTTASYRRAVKRAIDAVNADRGDEQEKLPHWSPRQVRHSKAGAVRRGHERGIEATQAALRHSQVETSQIYAERSEELARDVARRFG